MKKIISLLLMLVLAFSMSSCGEGSSGVLSLVESASPTRISTVTAYVVSDTEVYNGNYTMSIEGNDSIFEFTYERPASIEEKASGAKVSESGVVYYKDGLYSYDGSEWNAEAPSAVKISFNLKREYFDTCTESGNNLVATVSGENIAKVLGSAIGVDGAVTIEVKTNGIYVTRIDVDYKSTNGATVSVATSYTYDEIDLKFPGEPAEDNGGAEAE